VRLFSKNENLGLVYLLFQSGTFGQLKGMWATSAMNKLAQLRLSFLEIKWYASSLLCYTLLLQRLRALIHSHVNTFRPRSVGHFKAFNIETLT